jgi:hypothetical protein
MMDQLLIDTEHFTLSSWEFFVRLLVSIGIGVVIGLERQYSAIKEHANGYFGIRTFTFYALLGCVSVLFYFLFSPWIYIALFRLGNPHCRGLLANRLKRRPRVNYGSHRLTHLCAW